jgi:hypothetical protein
MNFDTTINRQQATSLTLTVQQAATSPAVVCRYLKEEKWNEPTYAMCLSEFENFTTVSGQHRRDRVNERFTAAGWVGGMIECG